LSLEHRLLLPNVLLKNSTEFVGDGPAGASAGADGGWPKGKAGQAQEQWLQHSNSPKLGGSCRGLRWFNWSRHGADSYPVARKASSRKENEEKPSGTSGR